MKTNQGHLSYCSNIHPGEIWAQHFAELQKNVPLVKAQVSPDLAMGLGLRIANQASIDLQNPKEFDALKSWLTKENLYVFTLNGFPFGGFHDTVVKDQVHAPDWTTPARYEYTLRLAHILANLLPENEQEGSISTSPISYKYWWDSPEKLDDATKKGTLALLELVIALADLEKVTGKWIHIDIEPEPDGILENHREFVDWYEGVYLSMGKEFLKARGKENEEALLRRHVQLCFDICHYGVSFDKPSTCIQELIDKQIPVGKIQISSALRVDLREDPLTQIEALRKYHEPVYLHQVKALGKDGSYIQYRDLDEAIADFTPERDNEWRVHFHVPLFLENYGLLGSTQQEIRETIAFQNTQSFTRHLEIETYTWGVLPAEFQVPMDQSISREIQYIQGLLKK
jgi:hypothetical protein